MAERLGIEIDVDSGDGRRQLDGLQDAVRALSRALDGLADEGQDATQSLDDAGQSAADAGASMEAGAASGGKLCAG